jgi:hypothetical protein
VARYTHLHRSGGLVEADAKIMWLNLLAQF